jgi:hypothetical protein
LEEIHTAELARPLIFLVLIALLLLPLENREIQRTIALFSRSLDLADKNNCTSQKK